MTRCSLEVRHVLVQISHVQETAAISVSSNTLLCCVVCVHRVLVNVLGYLLYSTLPVYLD